MNEFIWKSKVNKVSHNVLIQNYENGGLKMIDIGLFLTALKASWVKRIIDDNNDGQWKLLYKKNLEKNGGEFFFKCNYHYTDVAKLLKVTGFLKDVLEAWCKLNYNNDQNILDQILWNNFRIRHQDKPIIYKSWLTKGIVNVRDIVFNNKIMSFNQIRTKYDIAPTEYLKYHSLVSALPRAWKIDLQDVQTNVNEESESVCLINKVRSITKPCKMMYNILLNKIDYCVKAKQKWEQFFLNEQLDWPRIYKMAFDNTYDTKLRNFQYKFLQKILPTNTFLYKCKLVSSRLCDFCNQEQETDIHLFWECYFVQDFWGKLSEFLSENGLLITFSKQTVCLGKMEKGFDLHNFIILCAKHYIYCCKFRSIVPSLTCFKLILKQKKEIEKNIALKTDTYQKYNNKWSILNSLDVL